MSIYVNAAIRVKVQFQKWKLIIRNTYKLTTTTVNASIETKLSRMKIELNMKYLVWESNPRLSVHEADTLPTDLTRFLYLQSRVRTDDLQNYSLTLYQLSYWQNRVQEHEKLKNYHKKGCACAIPNEKYVIIT